MIKEITARDNKALKTLRSLNRKKGREQAGLYFAEGVRLVEEAITYIKDEIQYLVMSKSYSQKNIEKLQELAKSFDVYVAEDKIFNEACDTQTPQGIAAVIKYAQEKAIKFDEMKYMLILDGVSEPGNMGTIIRTAEASGIDCICLMEGCADIYNPKVVRSAMGSMFRMSFVKSDLNTIKEIKNADFYIVATALENSMPIEKIKLSDKRAIVIGNEAHGVSEEVIKLSDISVRIDMKGKVESLNAAVAAGIIMYMLKGV